MAFRLGTAADQQRGLMVEAPPVMTVNAFLGPSPLPVDQRGSAYQGTGPQLAGSVMSTGSSTVAPVNGVMCRGGHPIPHHVGDPLAVVTNFIRME